MYGGVFHLSSKLKKTERMVRVDMHYSEFFSDMKGGWGSTYDETEG